MSGAPRILIVAGELSGDLRGAELAHEIRRLRPEAEIIAVGGPHLRAAGARIVMESEELSVMGLTEGAARAGAILRAWSRLKRLVRGREAGERPPDLLIPIDFPDFNLRLARVARRAGIKVLYYVSPQVWAWRRYRVRTLARRVDHLAVVFPFEEEIYRGLCPVTFIGHPAVDTARASASRAALRHELGLTEGERLVALLPGSRRAEVGELLPIMRDALRELGPGLRVVVALASESLRPLVEEILALPGRPGSSESTAGLSPPLLMAGRNFDVVPEGPGEDGGSSGPLILAGRTFDIVAAADVVAVASGSATLEVALLGTPMVVLYRLSRLSFAVARRLVRVPWIAMPNLILDREAVPELVQNEATPERLAAELRAILADPEREGAMRTALGQVREKLGLPGAAQRGAELALSLLAPT